jgi:hypothetical protein
MLERDIRQGIFQGEGRHTCLSTASSDSLYEITYKIDQNKLSMFICIENSSETCFVFFSKLVFYAKRSIVPSVTPI